jgi:hypothetical protein
MKRMPGIVNYKRTGLQLFSAVRRGMGNTAAFNA